MIIVKSVQSGKFYLVEFIKDSFIYTSIDADFALTSKLPLANYHGDGFFWDFREFVLENKPA